MTHCSLNPPAGIEAGSAGGAIYAQSSVYLYRSKITENTVYSSGNSAAGGGVFSAGGFTSLYSVVSNNRAMATEGRALGGGVYAKNGPLAIRNSAITNNHSDQDAGGLFILGGPGGEIANSTISGNAAGNICGGIEITKVQAILLSNSSVAFNSEATAGSDPHYVAAAGVYLSIATLTAQSTIVANSLNDAFPSNPYSDVAGSLSSVEGSNNLVRFSYLAMPPDTIYADPLLETLAYNGIHAHASAERIQSCAKQRQ